MKIPYSVIKSWTKFKGTPDDLRALIDLHITEVESVGDTGRFSHMVVGQILDIQPHPDADRLRLTSVNVGDQNLAIVCGANNIQVGQKVPVALQGSTVANGTQIKLTTIRGVESYGMLCSADELGIAAKGEGIFVLDADLEVGTPLSEIFDEDGESIFDIKVLADRPDYSSYLSVAREVAASAGLKWNFPLALDYTESSSLKTTELVSVANNTKGNQCPRYTVKVVTEVVVADSPLELRQAVEAVGLRSVNNVVDIANLVMLETGQPIHAFDLDKLAKNQLQVRLAKVGDSIAALNDETYKLTHDDIVIADAKGVVAIAGIIGSAGSAVDAATTRLAIEIATFNRAHIRATSRRLGLRTDASGRFERGIDPHLADLAWKRLLNLISTHIPTAKVAKGMHDLSTDLPPAHTEKKFRLDLVNKITTAELPNRQIVDILTSLDLPSAIDGKALTIKVPSYRQDIISEADVAEEIIRIYGLDKIVSQAPTLALVSPAWPDLYRLQVKTQNLLVRMGAIELRIHPFDKGGSKLAVKLKNPLNDNQTHLKTALLPSLFAAGEQWEDQIGFELGKIFMAGKEELPTQPIHLALVVAGDQAYRRARGLLNQLLMELGVAVNFGYDPTGLNIEINRTVIGQITQQANNLAGFELNIEALLPHVVWNKNFVEPAKYPAVKFDLAFVVKKQERVGEMIEVMQAIDPLVASIELFDIFSLSATEHSLAFHVELRASDKTLTKEDRDAIQAKIVSQLSRQFKAKLRE